MACPYMKYRDGDKYFPRLYCGVDDHICIFAKRCDIEEKFIPNGELWRDCEKMINEKKKDIPTNSYYVQITRPNKKGFLYLYVLMGDKIVKIQSDLTELNQNYVYVKEGLDGYEVSLVPFVEKPKRTTRKKTESND